MRGAVRRRFYQLIADDVTLGADVQIHSFVNLYGCSIGDNTKIGTFVEIQRGATVGANCKISSHTFICSGVTIADGVFVGHHVVFINDKLPRATDGAGELKTFEDWKSQKTYVGAGASIGSGAVILGGVHIGENALIGAGAVVTQDVPRSVVVVGHAARILRRL